MIDMSLHPSSEGTLQTVGWPSFWVSDQTTNHVWSRHGSVWNRGIQQNDGTDVTGTPKPEYRILKEGKSVVWTNVDVC